MDTVYCGMDLSCKDAMLAWADGTSKIVREQRIPLTGERLREAFSEQRERVLVGCEATSNAFWVHDVLSRLGVEIRIAPTYQLKIVTQTCYKSDRVDARKMAWLLSKNMFPAIWVPPVRLRDLRERARLRNQLVRSRTQWMCRHRSLLYRWGLVGEVEGEVLPMEPRGEGDLGAATRETDEEIIQIVKELTRRIREIQADVLRRIQEVPAIQKVVDLLRSVPGVGPVTSTTLALEIGQIDRFARPKKFFRYCRLTPGVRQSGKVRHALPLAKDARADLCWLLIEAAWRARRTDRYFGALYERRLASGDRPGRAIVPVARSLAHAIYKVWSQETPYPKLFPPQN